MNILLYKTGKLVITDAGEPTYGDEGELIACITNPQEGDVLTYNGTMWVNAQPTTPEANDTEE